jgi:broad specificity phosphatase PhoE
MIYLARHGETDWNRDRRWQGQSDIVLNEVGRAQARELADALRSRGLERAAASDLSRARETAEIVSLELGLGGVEVDPGLRERAFGVFEGLTESECIARFPQQWRDYRSDLRCPPPGGEAYQSVAERMRMTIERFSSAVDGATGGLLLVSHGGAIRSFLLAVTGVLPPPLGNGAVFSMHFDSGSFRDIERLR